MRRTVLLIALLQAVAPSLSAPQSWILRSRHKAEADPHEVILPFQACRLRSPDACLDGVVPGTVLEAMLLNDSFGISRGASAKVEDLYFEDNLRRIVDVYDTGNAFYSFAYETKIACDLFRPSDTEETWLLWLTFQGINYRAELFVQNRHVGSMAGAFTTHRFLLPKDGLSEEEVNVRVEVTPPDFVGRVDGGQGGDHEIARNAATPQFSAGWDWIRGTPDRNTGIWDDIELRRTGCLTLSQIHTETLGISFESGRRLRSSGLPLDDVEDAPNEAVRSALVRYEALIQNHCGTQQSGRLHVTLSSEHGSHSFVFPISIVPESSEHRIQESIRFVDDPVLLWWPHTHGQAHLYTVDSDIFVAGAQAGPSDHFTHRLGVRVVQPYNVGAGASRSVGFCVNGVRVFLQGGNWIASDQLLRHSASRYRKEIHRNKAAGLNLIRVWAGGIAERHGFYAAADEAGMLVMQELFLTGDNNGRWGGSYEYPEDAELYLRAVHDTVGALRRHASLLFWCLGNEIGPASSSPKPAIRLGLSGIFAALDPNRYFVASSMYARGVEGDGRGAAAGISSQYTLKRPYALSPKDGPYGMLPLSEFWEPNPGLDALPERLASHPIPFQPEVGSASLPTYRGLQSFLGSQGLEQFPTANCTSAVHPLWQFHNYESFCSVEGTNTYDWVHAYAVTDGGNDTETFAFAAQLAQKQQYQALFEGFRSKALAPRTAVLLWKAQTPWPALRGFLYDHDLFSTGGFYGVMSALGSSPDRVSIQLRWDAEASAGQSWGIDVISLRPVRTLDGDKASWVSEYQVEISVVSIRGDLLMQNSSSVGGQFRAGSNPLPMRLPWIPCSASEKVGNSCVRLYRLILQQASADEAISRKDYWLGPPEDPTPDYSAIGRLRKQTPIPLDVRLLGAFRRTQGIEESFAVTVELSNHLASTSRGVAFGVILEAFWCGRQMSTISTDGYFYMLPNEARVLEVLIQHGGELSWGWTKDREATCRLEEGELMICVEGWNVPTSCATQRLSLLQSAPS